MSTKLETARRDWNGDGIFDETVWTTSQFTDGKLITEYEHADRSEPGTDSLGRVDYTYDAAGREIREARFQDSDFNGTWQDAGTLDTTYDAAGRISTEVLFSPDFDGDTLIGDYANWTLYTYDGAGRLVAKDQDFFASGYQGASDYINERWTYDTAGRLASYSIDDPIMFDCVITRTNTYDRRGLLQNIREQNEIRYGDDRPRIDESFTYNKDGAIKTHTDWADYSDKGWFQRVDTAYTFDGGYHTQRVTYDLEGDFKPEAVKFVEYWHNTSGQLTHVLVSHDDEGNGGPLFGGFDRRDLTVQVWSGSETVSQTVDLGLDGIIDYSFTSEWIVA